MAKIKYYYNTETCKYEPVKVSKFDVIANFLLFFSVAIILALGFIYIYDHNYPTFKESRLKAENEELKLDWRLLNKKLDDLYEGTKSLQEKDDHVYRVIADADPVATTIRQAGIGGYDRLDTLKQLRLEEESLILNTYERLQKLRAKMYIQTKSYDEIMDITAEKAKEWASRPAIQPVNNKELTRLHTTFGRRFHPILRIWKPHEGLDFTAPTGTPVYATGDGSIKVARYSNTYGNVIYIDHGYGFETRYAHLSSFPVKKGQKVKRGDLIGYVGNTGRSQAAHLHYEVRYHGKAINPIDFFHRDLSVEEYEKLIDLSDDSATPLDY
ncbi:MAG: M23 family metallopeptidase [Bacteroidota bacterium]